MLKEVCSRCNGEGEVELPQPLTGVPHSLPNQSSVGLSLNAGAGQSSRGQRITCPTCLGSGFAPEG